jgi:hypothetical protein
MYCDQHSVQDTGIDENNPVILGLVTYRTFITEDDAPERSEAESPLKDRETFCSGY